MRILTSVAGCVALVASSLAYSQAPNQGGAAKPEAERAPAEIVCETQSVVGSRLSKKRVCMTRAEWAQSRSDDRQAVEKVQIQRSMKGE